MLSPTFDQCMTGPQAVHQQIFLPNNRSNNSSLQVNLLDANLKDTSSVREGNDNRRKLFDNNIINN